MLEKYAKVKKDTLDYIHNEIKLGTDRDLTVDKVMARFPVFVSFFETSNDMIKEMLEWIYEAMYREIHHKHYDNTKL